MGLNDIFIRSSNPKSVVQEKIFYLLFVAPPSKLARDPMSCSIIASCYCCALSKHCFITSAILSPCWWVLLQAAFNACLSSSLSSLSTSSRARFHFSVELHFFLSGRDCCTGVACEPAVFLVAACGVSDCSFPTWLGLGLVLLFKSDNVPRKCPEFPKWCQLHQNAVTF